MNWRNGGNRIARPHAPEPRGSESITAHQSHWSRPGSSRDVNGERTDLWKPSPPGSPPSPTRAAPRGRQGRLKTMLTQSCVADRRAASPNATDIMTTISLEREIRNRLMSPPAFRYWPVPVSARSERVMLTSQTPCQQTPRTPFGHAAIVAWPA